MFLLKIQTIVRCNMLDKLVELCKNDLVSTIVESESPKIMIPFKRTCHSPNNVIVQPLEKIAYDKNSSPRTSSIVQVIFSFWSFEISEDILRNQKFIIG